MLLFNHYVIYNMQQLLSFWLLTIILGVYRYLLAADY